MSVLDPDLASEPSSTPSTSLLERLLRGWVLAEEGRNEASFARLLGVNQSTVTRLKARSVLPSTSTLAAVCVILEASRADCIELYQEAGHVLPPALRSDRLPLSSGATPCI